MLKYYLMNIEEGFLFVKVVSLINILFECIKVFYDWWLIFGDYDEFNLLEW